jgi:hypothetical protein
MARPNPTKLKLAVDAVDRKKQDHDHDGGTVNPITLGEFFDLESKADACDKEYALFVFSQNKEKTKNCVTVYFRGVPYQV